MERFNFRKYLFIPEEGATEDVTEVFHSEAIQFVADRNILTHKYSGVEDHNNIIVLDKWYSVNRSFEFGRNLYPNKLLNQFGRTLRLGTIDYVPYSIIDSLDGLDISILMELAKKLNMTVELVLDLTVQWGDIYNNFTGNGILGNLVMDRTDVGFGRVPHIPTCTTTTCTDFVRVGSFYYLKI
ncbi:hypothetical protein QE152_g29799 [Popillia japonica]|uniref:Uncharacterized protein n=1 Tax=Popillia japonica TaxID=7064 RepID=A0AAW1JGY8_POPJA